MTTAARDILKAFDALPPAEQHEVATEILRRSMPEEELSETALDELADELFRRYDAEAADRATS